MDHFSPERAGTVPIGELVDLMLFRDIFQKRNHGEIGRTRRTRRIFWNE